MSVLLDPGGGEDLVSTHTHTHTHTHGSPSALSVLANQKQQQHKESSHPRECGRVVPGAPTQASDSHGQHGFCPTPP